MVFDNFRTIFNELMPPQCVSCGCPLISAGASGSYKLCPDCFEPFRLSPFEEAVQSKSLCLRCGEIVDSDRLYKTICVNCMLSPMPIRFVRSYFYYDDNTNDLLKKLKYCGNYSLGFCLGHLMASKASALFSNPDWDLILPIPSSPSILSDRGYNHTGLITQAFSRKAKVTTSMFALAATRHRKPQASLGLKERAKNMRNVFHVSKKKVANLRVLLIDDTITSGATMISAAKTLMINGVRSVDVLSLLRSPYFSISRQGIVN